MANWSEPTNNTNTLNVLSALNDKIANTAKLDFTGDTNLPSGVIRYNSTSKLFESWNGTSWTSLQVLFPDGTAAAPSISFSADTDTGIFRAGDAIISFSGNNTSTMHFDGNGLVLGNSGASSSTPGTGIIRGTYGGGTNIAGAPITIIGGRSTGNAAGGHIAFQTSAAGSSGSTNNTLTERMRITSAGDIYLGNGTTSAAPITTNIRSTGGTGTNVAGAELNLFGGQSTGSGTGGPIRFFTSPAGSSGSSPNTNTERMRITSAGNVGIGRTTAFSRLHIEGAAEAEGAALGQLIIKSSAAFDASPTAGIIFQINQSGSVEAYTASIYAAKENATVDDRRTALIFGTRSSAGTTAERMRITSGGQIQVGDGSAASPGLSFNSDTDTGIYRNAADHLVFGTGGAGKVIITPTGQVVVGQGHNGGTPVAGSVIGAAGSGTNIGGANLTISGGNSTGTGAGGVLIFQTAAAGSSGSAANTLTERMRVKTNGQVRFVPLAADPAGAEDGDVYYNSTTNKLRVRAGGAWVDLH